MQKLLPIIITGLILAMFSEMSSKKHPITGEYIYKDKFVFIILTVTLSMFVGLRAAYNDTFAYRWAYQLMQQASDPFDRVSWTIGDNVGFMFTNACLVKLGVSVQSFLMFYAFITIGIYLWFLRKYSTHTVFTLFLFLSIGCYTFTLAAIKQCVAMAFGLIGIDRAIRKKWIGFVVWILLGITFHSYLLMFLVTPFLQFKPWSKYTYWLLAIFIAAGFGMQTLVGTLISITSMMGESYNAASFGGEGVNIFRLMVCWVPVILSYLLREQIKKENDPVQEILLNLTMLNAAIMFVALFGTANYFARLANYFLIFSTLSIPWLLSKFEFRSRMYLTSTAVICYFLYFYYSNAIVQIFDLNFRGISLSEYINSLF